MVTTGHLFPITKCRAVHSTPVIFLNVLHSTVAVLVSPVISSTLYQPFKCPQILMSKGRRDSDLYILVWNGIPTRLFPVHRPWRLLIQPVQISWSHVFEKAWSTSKNSPIYHIYYTSAKHQIAFVFTGKKQQTIFSLKNNFPVFKVDPSLQIILVYACFLSNACMTRDNSNSHCVLLRGRCSGKLSTSTIFDHNVISKEDTN